MISRVAESIYWITGPLTGVLIRPTGLNTSKIRCPDWFKWDRIRLNALLCACSEPTQRYLELLSAVLASGRAHITGPDGQRPPSPERMGWRKHSEGTGAYQQDKWRPVGHRIGWIDGDDLYLEPEAAYAAAQHLAKESDDSISVKPKTLHKRLHERGLMVTIDEARGVLTIRKTLEGTRRTVLHLRAGSLFSTKPDQYDQPDQDANNLDTQDPINWANSGSDFSSMIAEPDHETCPIGEVGEPDEDANGQVGRVGQVSQISMPLLAGGRDGREVFDV